MALFKQASVVDEIVQGMQEMQVKLASADQDAVESKRTRAFDYLAAAGERLAAAGRHAEAAAIGELLKTAQWKPPWELPKKPPPGKGLGYEDIPEALPAEKAPKPAPLPTTFHQQIRKQKEEAKPAPVERSEMSADRAISLLARQRETKPEEWGPALLYLRSVLMNEPWKGYFKGVGGMPDWVSAMSKMNPTALKEALEAHFKQFDIDPFTIKQQARIFGPSEKEREKLRARFKKEQEKAKPKEKEEEVPLDPEAALHREWRKERRKREELAFRPGPLKRLDPRTMQIIEEIPLELEETRRGRLRWQKQRPGLTGIAALRSELKQLLFPPSHEEDLWRKGRKEDLVSYMEDSPLRGALQKYLSNRERSELSLRGQLEALDLKLEDIEKEEKREQRKKERLHQRTVEHKGLEELELPEDLEREKEEAAAAEAERLRMFQEAERQKAEELERKKQLARKQFMDEQRYQRERERQFGYAEPVPTGKPWLWEEPPAPAPAPEPAPAPAAEPEDEDDWLSASAERLFALRKNATKNYRHAMRILAGDLDPVSQREVLQTGLGPLTAKKKDKKKDKLPKNPGKTEDEKAEWRMYGYSADDGDTDYGSAVIGDPHDEYQVVVLKPNEQPAVYYEKKPKHAKRRAQALADHFGTQVDESEDGTTFTVDLRNLSPDMAYRFDEEKPGIEQREELEEGFED
jgi:hypothetical protein